MPGVKATERFMVMLRESASRSCSVIDRFIRERPGIDPPLITMEQIARAAGLVRRNGRIDDNQTYHMLALAHVRSSAGRRYGQRVFDARDVLHCLARWSGNWGYVDDPVESE